MRSRFGAGVVVGFSVLACCGLGKEAEEARTVISLFSVHSISDLRSKRNSFKKEKKGQREIEMAGK
jgi:hypothetical protein